MKLNKLFEVKDSNIHGVGIFAKKKINKNTKIDIGIKYYCYLFPCITKDFGSLINHSFKPNCTLEMYENNYFVTSNKVINNNEEITLNYNRTPWFIANAKDNYK